MTMVYVIAGLAGAAGLGWYVVVTQRRRIKRLREERSELKYRLQALREEIERRGHIIRRMEEVTAEASKDKRSLRRGSTRDRFDSSLDVLSDDTDADSGD